jgi:hypothetical protein
MLAAMTVDVAAVNHITSFPLAEEFDGRWFSKGVPADVSVSAGWLLPLLTAHHLH